MLTASDAPAPDPLVCLSIGSSDSSGGAGIQGDVKALAAIGCHAATVVVGVTAQNTSGVRHRAPLPLDVVAAQLRAVADDLPVRAVKIGTTWSVELVELLGDLVPELGVPVVVDPVMVTAAGGWLSSDGPGHPGAVRAAVLRHLFPIATVVTPNREEAELLAGGTGRDSQRVLATRLVDLGAASVVVSGGPDEATDWFHDGVEHRVISGPRHDNGADHGAGCAHSSVIAGLLAGGAGAAVAAAEARALVSAAVGRGLVGVGAGKHPVDMLDLRGRAVRSPTRAAGRDAS